MGFEVVVRIVSEVVRSVTEPDVFLVSLCTFFVWSRGGIIRSLVDNTSGIWQAIKKTAATRPPSRFRLRQRQVRAIADVFPPCFCN